MDRPTLLATTSLSLRARPSDAEVVCLGTWCKDDGDCSVVPVLDYPWRDVQRRREAIAYCDEMSERIALILAAELSTRFNLSHSNRGWCVLLWPTVNVIVMSIVHHWTCLRTAIESSSTLKVLSLGRDSVVVPARISDLITRLQGDELHQNLMDEIAIAAGLPISTADVSVREPGNGHFIKPAKPNRRSKTVSDFVKAAIRKLAKHAPCVLYEASLTPREALSLQFKSGLGIGWWPLVTQEETAFPPVDRGLRQRLSSALSDKFGQEDVERIVCQLLMQYLPRSLVEGLPVLQDLARRQFPSMPRTIVGGTGWLMDEVFKFWCAESENRGSVLQSTQHGGGYGMRQCPSVGERFEYRYMDRFISWGSNDAAPAQVIQLPVPPHFSVRNRSNEDKQQLLYVATAEPRIPLQINGVPMGPQMLDYYERQDRFFGALSSELHKCCLIRPNPADARIRSRFASTFSALAFDDFSRSFLDRVSESRLVVVDNLNTTFLQAMGSNVPTLLVFDPEVWSYKDAVAGDFQELERAKVFFSRVDDAAMHVNAVWGDVTGWWNSDPVKGAMTNFLAKYFLQDRHWVDRWRSALAA